MAMGFAPVLAKSLTCNNENAIQEDIKNAILELEWFNKSLQNQKSMYSSLCVGVMKAVLPKLINFGANKLPQEWGCTGHGIEITLEKLAIYGCSRI